MSSSASTSPSFSSSCSSPAERSSKIFWGKEHSVPLLSCCFRKLTHCLWAGFRTGKSFSGHLHVVDVEEMIRQAVAVKTRQPVSFAHSCYFCRTRNMGQQVLTQSFAPRPVLHMQPSVTAAGHHLQDLIPPKPCTGYGRLRLAHLMPRCCDSKKRSAMPPPVEHCNIQPTYELLGCC